MKKIILLSLSVFIFNFALAQTLNTEIPNNNKPYLIGEINKDGLKADNYKSWFNPNLANYAPDAKTIQAISEHINDYEIKYFMGTWCSDSKKQVPRLYKVLEDANYDTKKLTSIAVNRKKETQTQLEKGYNIHRVPTIIFYKDGKEVNRIVESPVTTIENDILDIINKNNYISNYNVINEIDNVVSKKGIKGLQKKAKKIAKKSKNNVKGANELNRYASFLTSKNKNELALETLKINALLFPEDSAILKQIGNLYKKTGKPSQADIYYNMAKKLVK